MRFKLHGGVMRPDSSLRGDGSVRLAGAEQIYIMPAGWSEAPWWSDRAGRQPARDPRGREARLQRGREPRRRRPASPTAAPARSTSRCATRRRTRRSCRSTATCSSCATRSSTIPGGLFLNNLRNKPLFIVNGGKDPLYPIDAVEPSIVHPAPGAACRSSTGRRPQAGHDTSWWPALKDEIEASCAPIRGSRCPTS